MKSHYGVPTEDIERSLLPLVHKHDHYPSIIELEEFKQICERYGHIVSDELPQKVRDIIFSATHCVYAEVIQRDHLLMSCGIIAVFDQQNAYRQTLQDISKHTFHLGAISITNVKVNSTQGQSTQLLNQWQGRSAG